MKEREAAGGLTERRPQTAATGLRAPAGGKPKDTATEDDKKKPTGPSVAPKDRPQTAKNPKEEEKKGGAPTKPVVTAPGKKPVPAKDEGDADDPIAKSLAERTKAGSITAVVGSKVSAPAKAPATTKPAEKKPAATDSKDAKKPDEPKKAPADKKPAEEEKKAKPTTATPAVDKKPAAKPAEESKAVTKPKEDKKPVEKKEPEKKPEPKAGAAKPADEKKSEPKKLVG